MDSRKLNFIISSRNKKQGDTNSSMYIQLLDDFYVEQDEQLTVCLSSFDMIKSFYACQPGLNDTFELIIKSDDDTVIQTCVISEGNYDVKSLMKEIIHITRSVEDMFQISYDSKLNKFIYYNQYNSAFDVFIKPINAGIFLGLQNGFEYLITAEGSYSSTFINVSGYTTMMIKLEGDMTIENTVSNVLSTNFTNDTILAILPLQNIAPMDSISYYDDGSCLFKLKITNTKTSSFRISILNEEGKSFPNMADWIMMLKFEKIKNTSPEGSVMNQLLYDIRYYIMSLYAYMNIPSRLTFNDVLGNQ